MLKASRACSQKNTVLFMRLGHTTSSYVCYDRRQVVNVNIETCYIQMRCYGRAHAQMTGHTENITGHTMGCYFEGEKNTRGDQTYSACI